MLLEDVKRVVAETTYPGYEFGVSMVSRGIYTIEGRFKAPCTINGGEPVWQYTRKWLLEYPTPSAVVGTLLKLVLTSLEHEAREMFLWKGKRVFDPHIDIHSLLSLQR